MPQAERPGARSAAVDALAEQADLVGTAAHRVIALATRSRAPAVEHAHVGDAAAARAPAARASAEMLGRATTPVRAAELSVRAALFAARPRRCAGGPPPSGPLPASMRGVQRPSTQASSAAHSSWEAHGVPVRGPPPHAASRSEAERRHAPRIPQPKAGAKPQRSCAHAVGRFAAPRRVERVRREPRMQLMHGMAPRCSRRQPARVSRARSSAHRMRARARRAPFAGTPPRSRADPSNLSAEPPRRHRSSRFGAHGDTRALTSRDRFQVRPAG